jgi:hypothetical protein
MPKRQAQNELHGRDWQLELQGFASRLLTCVWQTARRDRLLTAFFIGVNRQLSRELSQLSFSHICKCSPEAAATLQVRLADHPRYWPDLMRFTRSGTEAQQVASRLAQIQLAIGQQWPQQTAPRYL